MWEQSVKIGPPERAFGHCLYFTGVHNHLIRNQVPQCLVYFVIPLNYFSLVFVHHFLLSLYLLLAYLLLHFTMLLYLVLIKQSLMQHYLFCSCQRSLSVQLKWVSFFKKVSDVSLFCLFELLALVIEVVRAMSLQLFV